jgi:hypothetical protein
MTTAEWVELARYECQAALREPGIEEVSAVLEKAGIPAPARREALEATAREQSPSSSLLMFRSLLDPSQKDKERFPLERKILLDEALAALPHVATLPVDETVKQLFCKELIFIAQPTPESLPRFAMEGYTFVAYAKIVLLHRFPAGHYQWEISGFPRSWLLKVPPRLLPVTMRFLIKETRGFKPWFVSHMRATGPGTPFLVEGEFRKSFFRMALALEKQPQVGAVMAQSWLHSPETHRVSPHLAFLNRVFEEAGGLVTDLGPAQPDDGFATGNKQRAESYRNGTYRPTNGVVVCSRKQAIAWARKNGDLEPLIAIK